ncbi:MAG: HDOD domain-containing protein [Mariprofundaceae bacterium]
MSFTRSDTLELIRMSDHIPTLPDRFFKIQKTVRDSEADSHDLAAIISTDQATSSLILKMANSVCYNPGAVPVRKLSLAIGRLGFSETGSIASSIALFSEFSVQLGYNNCQILWAHAYATAELCKMMAEPFDLDAEEMFMLGLIHDIGTAVLGLRVDLSFFASTMGVLSGDVLIEAEQKHFDLDHTEAGAEMLRLWGFPADMIRTVAEHHDAATNILAARIVLLADNEAREWFSDVNSIEKVHTILQEKHDEIRASLLESCRSIN